jgi:hypothetical protein
MAANDDRQPSAPETIERIPPILALFCGITCTSLLILNCIVTPTDWGDNYNGNLTITNGTPARHSLKIAPRFPAISGVYAFFNVFPAVQRG